MIKPFCRWALLGSATLFVLVLGGCQQQEQTRSDFSMGERVPIGQMTYSVVESAWKTQLGQGFKIRTPEQRFLLIKVSVTNGTGKDVSIPLLTLEGTNGQTYRELADGDGVDNWFGVLRTISPGQTQQGNVVFDVPLTSYKLRVPDINDLGIRELRIRADSSAAGFRFAHFCTDQSRHSKITGPDRQPKIVGVVARYWIPLVLLFAAGALPAAPKLAFERLALHQYEDGPLLPESHEFLPGETIWFSARIDGFREPAGRRQPQRKNILAGADRGSGRRRRGTSQNRPAG